MIKCNKKKNCVDMKWTSKYFLILYQDLYTFAELIKSDTIVELYVIIIQLIFFFNLLTS